MQRYTQVMLKPSSDLCPMNCTYCFYKGYRSQKGVRSATAPQVHSMSIETLEAIIKSTIESSIEGCIFGFQGGEPCLRGLDFFKEAIRLQQYYNKRNIAITNNLQTSGILLDEQWCSFLHEHQFLVGLSLDGPEEIHNSMRLLPPKSSFNSLEETVGSFSLVMKAREMLREHLVSYNILAVVSQASALEGRSIYRFFRKLEEVYIQFIPAMDCGFTQNGSHSYSLRPEDLAVFLQDVFDLWYHDIVYSRRYIYVDLIERFLEKSLGFPPSSCFAGTKCSIQNIFEADGNNYACDFFVCDDLKLGNIHEEPSLHSMAQRAQNFVSEDILTECLSCPWFSLCQVGCRRYKVLKNSTNSPFDWNNRGKSYFCSSYKSFLGQSHKKLRYAAQLLINSKVDAQQNILPK